MNKQRSFKGLVSQGSLQRIAATSSLISLSDNAIGPVSSEESFKYAKRSSGDVARHFIASNKKPSADWTAMSIPSPTCTTIEKRHFLFYFFALLPAYPQFKNFFDGSQQILFALLNLGLVHLMVAKSDSSAASPTSPAEQPDFNWIGTSNYGGESKLLVPQTDSALVPSSSKLIQERRTAAAMAAAGEENGDEGWGYFTDIQDETTNECLMLSPERWGLGTLTEEPEENDWSFD